MNKFPFLLVCGMTGLVLGGVVAKANAQTAVPRAGANPAGICVKSYGVTYYPAQDLGCFNRPRSGGCHCDDWEGPPPPPPPSPTPGPVTPGVGGWSDRVINDQFLAHLKDKKSNAKGAEKAEFKLDIKEFKENLKADRE